MTNKQTSNVSDVIEGAVDEIEATSALQPTDIEYDYGDPSINYNYTTQEEEEAEEVDEEVDRDDVDDDTAKKSTQNDSEYVEPPAKSKLPLYAGIGCGVALIAVAGALLVPKFLGANESPVNTKTATEQQAVVSTPPVATDPAVSAAALAGIPPVTAEPAPPGQPPVTGVAAIGSPAGVATADSTGIPTDIPPVGMPPVGTTPVAQSAPTSVVPATSVAATTAVAPTTKATPSVESATPEGVVVFKTPSCEASFDAAKNGDTKCGYTIYKQTKSPKSAKSSIAAQAKSNLKAKTKTKVKVIAKKKAKEPVTKRSASYSLYAAKGGRIWLSQSGSETDGTGVKSYVVGDVLPNGAKIVSITQPDGNSRKTKVKTTQGWISD